MINRRGFIKSLIAFTVARHSLGGFSFSPSPQPLSLHGIPFYCSDATYGEWLGLPRNTIYGICEELITLLEKDKKENPLTLQINPLQSDITPNTNAIISDIKE